ncbi:nucleopolyhedrovirus P10 family protein [Streptomyces sp. NPDC060002]|uniref:nucleopolyhedrovirus P10 family protein n=1 Tax=Streptomyces sp. NPDC060002 TaxID=3347033 RepID=UPI00368ACCCE
MTADGWTSAVRHQLGLGRLLPLGGPRDGAWITEAAAEAVLRRAARTVEGVRMGALRVGPADPEGAFEPVVPAPPSALAPGPLRVTAECAALASEPLPTAAARLRGALSAAAEERLGLVVSAVDLTVTALLDVLDMLEEQPEREPSGAPSAAPVPGGAALLGDEALAATAALSVPGVTGTSRVLGRAVRIEERQDATAALPRRHARVEITVGADRRALDVARAVRAVVSEALPDHPTVAVLVTAVG